MIYKNMFKSFSSIFLFLLCVNLSKALVISEIYPKPPTPKTNKEWIEIFNNSSEPLNITGYKFFENNTNHSVATTTAEDSLILNSGEYAVIVQDRKTFLESDPGKNYTGKVLRSAGFSLDDNSETLVLKDKQNGNILDSVTYNASNLKDGESLHFTGTSYESGKSSPGTGNLSITVTSSYNSVATGTESISNATSSLATSTDNFIQPTYYNRNYWPESEKIYVNAGENKIGVLGGDIDFEAKTLTGDKRQVGNANYFWSFGDGAIAEGKNVSHEYKFTGEYVVFVESYANGAKSDGRVYVKVIEPNLEVQIKENFNKKFVEIKNNSKEEIDIGGFLIKSFGGEFEYTSTLPKKLLILPNRSVNFSQEILKFATSTNKIIFTYQNGKEIGKSEIINQNTQTIVDNLSGQIFNTKEISVMTKENFEKLQHKQIISTPSNLSKSPNISSKKRYYRQKIKIPNPKEEDKKVSRQEDKFIIKNEDKNIFYKVFEYFGI